MRDAADYFDEIKDVKITKDMLDLAKHIDQNSGHFDPEKFEDHYEKASNELVTKKQKGLPITAPKRPEACNVVDLMDALRQSLKSEPASRTKKTPAKKVSKKRKAG